MLNLPPQPRFLITRLSAIGDCVHTVPLVNALRARFPSCLIAWATQGAGAQLLNGLDGLDEVVEVKRDWLRRPASVRAMRSTLRSLRIDVAIDPQSLTKSSLLGWLSGAKSRIGFARGQGRELSPWLNNIVVRPNTEHVVDRYLELLSPLGIAKPSVRFNLPKRNHANTTMRAYLTRQGLVDFALLNPGAGWNSKRWPHLRYAEVARHLFTRHGIRSVVLWAGEREHAWAKEIVDSSADASYLAPDTSLPELTELCRLAKLFVGSDTGPMHLAAAVETPCVAMYGPTRISVCGPYAVDDTMHVPLQVRFQSGTSKERRGDDNSAMQEITTNAVASACDRILSHTQWTAVA